MNSLRQLALVALSATVAVALAGCSSSPSSNGATTQPVVATAAAGHTATTSQGSTPSATSAPSGPTAAQLAFPSTMTAAGFFPGGTPDYAIDAAADAVCGSLQSESMSAAIAYEEQVDKNTTTGMTTNKDILLFVTDSVKAFCPQYAHALPAS